MFVLFDQIIKNYYFKCQIKLSYAIIININPDTEIFKNIEQIKKWCRELDKSEMNDKK